MTKTEQGWVITQENLPKGKVEVQGYTFSYSKADAIKLFIEGSEMTWAQCRKQYGWNVRKAKLTIEIVSNLTKQSETYTKTSKIKSQKNNDTAK